MTYTYNPQSSVLVFSMRIFSFQQNEDTPKHRRNAASASLFPGGQFSARNICGFAETTQRNMDVSIEAVLWIISHIRA